ncbi:MAG: tRNA 2-selenouridine(34) synthase MnmH [Candidatus Kapabacteria bacterium]|nr:tRNA 2-selenouridine(34) synthase MnmH [Candidatus Kapabacteria bacterium]
MTSALDDIYNDGFAVVDVRTPAEYTQGHIVGAKNLPLFTNEERAEVGTLYVQTSREAAIQRGLELVGHKLASFVSAARALGKPLIVYCWRGGMRSSSMSWLFTTAGLQSRTIPRGYKGFRQLAHERIAQPWQWHVVSGKTGSGKTTYLREMASRGEQVLDLEGLANHRGSSFGGIGLPPQPTTEHMLNLLHHAMRDFDEARQVWLEDESRTIGRVHLPEHLYNCIRSAPRHELDVPIDVRIANLVTEYGALPTNELAAAFERIREKFGGERTQRALTALEAGNLALAAEIALEYYDRTYEFSAKRR